MDNDIILQTIAWDQKILDCEIRGTNHNKLDAHRKYI